MRILLFGLVLLTAGLLHGQQKAYEVEGLLHGGFLWPHRGSMSHLTEGHIGGFEIGLLWKTDGSKAWHRSYNLPKPGVSFLYLNLNNPDLLGHAFGLYPNIYFPVVKNDKLSWGFEAGYGLGYLTKRFNRKDNHKNIAIGSKLNGVVQLATQMEIKIKDEVELDLALTFIHFSNASAKTPNLGVNLPTISTGISYDFGETSSTSEPDTTDNLDKRIRYSGNLVYAFKEIVPTGGDVYHVWGVTLLAEKRLTPKSRFAVGFDLMQDPSNYQKLLGMGDTLSGKSDVWKAGIAPGYELVIGKVSLVGQFGVYLRAPYKEDGMFYHRIGSRVQITDNIRINFLLKSHFAVADYFEWGLGYRF